MLRDLEHPMTPRNTSDIVSQFIQELIYSWCVAAVGPFLIFQQNNFYTSAFFKMLRPNRNFQTLSSLVLLWVVFASPFKFVLLPSLVPMNSNVLI